MKRIITTLLFVTLLAAPKVPVLADTDSNLGSIQETLTSAIDGSLFVAHFDPDANKVSFVDMEGESMGYRYVDSEEEFWELVEINTKVTNQSIEERLENTQDRNDEEFLGATRELYSPRAQSSRFDTGIINVPYIPFAMWPDIWGVWVGGGTYRTQTSHRFIDLYTYNFPTDIWGVNTIDVFFTNAIGDDTSMHLHVGQNSYAYQSLRFPGESYGARVSSYQGELFNVPLRLFSW